MRRALLLMVAAAVMFGGMAFAAKLASANLSGSQVAMIRFASGLLPVILVRNHLRKALSFKRPDLILMRGLFGGTAVLCYFLAIEHTTVGIATLLNYTAPIFSGVFSMLFIGERVRARVLIPLPFALAGIVLVIRAHAHPGDVFGVGRWELLGLLSAILSGAAVTAMRAARRGENSWSVYGSFCLLGLIVTAPFGIATWRTPTASDWIALAATSVLSIGAQLLLTFSLRWVDAMTVGVISQLAVLVSMALGVTMLGETIMPMAAIGSTLALGGVIGVVYVTSIGRQASTAAEVSPEG